MSWDAIGAIGEVVGAFAVVLSLLYLALQIRHGLTTASDSAAKNTIAMVVAQLNAIAEDKNRSAITKGLSDYRSLSGDEKVAFDSLITSLLMVASSSFMSNKANLLPDELFDGWSGYLQPRFFSYPGAQEWWDESKAVFLPEMQAWVEKEFSKADSKLDFWRIK